MNRGGFPRESNVRQPSPNAAFAPSVGSPFRDQQQQQQHAEDRKQREIRKIQEKLMAERLPLRSRDQSRPKPSSQSNLSPKITPTPAHESWGLKQQQQYQTLPTSVSPSRLHDDNKELHQQEYILTTSGFQKVGGSRPQQTPQQSGSQPPPQPPSGPTFFSSLASAATAAAAAAVPLGSPCSSSSASCSPYRWAAASMSDLPSSSCGVTSPSAAAAPCNGEAEAMPRDLSECGVDCFKDVDIDQVVDMEYSLGDAGL